MAERLTMQEVIEHCETIVAHAEMVGWTDAKIYIEHKQVAEWLKELKHYKDVEEAGKLITLPCKIGDTVYFIGEDGSIIEKATRTIEEVMNYKPLIGRGCYLTCEEAEAALKEVGK